MMNNKEGGGVLALDVDSSERIQIFGFTNPTADLVVASGDPFTTDSRDADPLEIGDDFVVSVGFGTEDGGTAILNVPEPGAGWALA